MSSEKIKNIFQNLISTRSVNGHIEGPKENVLVCDSMNDWVIAGSELAKAGYVCSSPGSYGGSHPYSRQNTHKKIWKSGTLCAIVIEKRFIVFSLPQTDSDYCQIPLIEG